MTDTSGAAMTDAERIMRLEAVLATLIAWLHRELGTHGARQLLDRLAATPAALGGNDD